MVKILQPMPKICPSALYSMAEAATELAKPVMGTREPAPPNLPIFRINMKTCEQDTGKNKNHRAPGTGSFFIKPLRQSKIYDGLSDETDGSSGKKCLCHI